MKSWIWVFFCFNTSVLYACHDMYVCVCKYVFMFVSVWTLQSLFFISFSSNNSFINRRPNAWVRSWLRSQCSSSACRPSLDPHLQELEWWSLPSPLRLQQESPFTQLPFNSHSYLSVWPICALSNITGLEFMTSVSFLLLYCLFLLLGYFS